jgi:hypothetical protein
MYCILASVFFCKCILEVEELCVYDDASIIVNLIRGLGDFCLIMTVLKKKFL